MGQYVDSWQGYEVVADLNFWLDAMKQATRQSPTLIGKRMYEALEARGDDWFTEAVAQGRIMTYQQSLGFCDHDMATDE